MDFGRIFNMQGFDFNATPFWQMVPVGGDRYLAAGDATGMSFRSSNPAVVTVQEIGARELPDLGPRFPFLPGDRCIKLHGVAKGSAKVFAFNGSTLVGTLDVDTKNLKRVTISFNFVEDDADKKTTHVPAEAPEWLAELNWIYQQCNVQFVCRQARWIHVDRDLGYVIKYIPEGTAKENEEWNAVVAKLDRTAEVNVFHFNDIRLGNAVNDNAYGLTWKKCSMIDDDAPNYVATMAHEIGHTQGLDHFKGPRQELNVMGAAAGVGINKDQAKIMNP